MVTKAESVSDRKFEESVILIRNKDKQDNKFGAKLITYEEQPRRHVFMDVIPGGAAYQMNIKNGDEIECVGDKELAAKKTHRSVLDDLRDNSVPGNKSWSVVKIKTIVNNSMYRRKIDYKLTPCSTGDGLNSTSRCSCKYKAEDTRYYLALNGDSLGVSVLPKATGPAHVFVKLTCSKIERLNSEFNVALFNSCQTRSIGVEAGEIVVKDVGEGHDWFRYVQGKGASFQSISGRYLAYDNKEHKVKAQDEEYSWEEFPVEGDMDSPTCA